MSPITAKEVKKETDEVAVLYEGVKQLLNTQTTRGKIGDCKCGVYLFYDYDEEPIYVGQTREGLRTRIRRHLTNQRTDAVAMSVLDPYEVAEIEMWPFWDLEESSAKTILKRAEYTVYVRALENSRFGVILNEAEVTPEKPISLPNSVRGTLLPPDELEKRKHPDTRVARRARTIANLARIISERRVKLGLRKTLHAQARRLEQLAERRLDELSQK